MFGSTLILAAMIGQPGASAPPKQWIDTTDPRTGRAARILGWRDADGTARYDPIEYPWMKPAPGPVGKPVAGFPAGGVSFEKMPTVQAGAEWYGGNVHEAVGDAGERDEKTPDVYLTVIGDDAQRAAVRARFEQSPEFRDTRDRMGDRLAVHFYPPSNPMVRKVGLVDDGRPDVVIQDANGNEVRRWHDDPGPGPVVAKVREADPGYRPGDHEKTKAEADDWSAFAWSVVGGAALGLVMIALARGGTAR